MIMDLLVPQNGGNFLISGTTINFSRRTLLCGFSFTTTYCDIDKESNHIPGREQVLLLVNNKDITVHRSISLDIHTSCTKCLPDELLLRNIINSKPDTAFL
jgi:hypothetical protein